MAFLGCPVVCLVEGGTLLGVDTPFGVGLRGNQKEAIYLGVLSFHTFGLCWLV